MILTSIITVTIPHTCIYLELSNDTNTKEGVCLYYITLHAQTQKSSLLKIHKHTLKQQSLLQQVILSGFGY